MPAITRRSFLGAAAAYSLAQALEDPQPHGLRALLDGVTVVRIPPGEFLMGSDIGYEDEQPAHPVRISRGFEMGKFEVTQSQWEAIMSDPHTRTVNNPSNQKGATLPVESVSFDDIQEFLRRINLRDKEHVYRLPTEAEWEYACRAGTKGDYAGDLNSMAWYSGNSDDRSHPIGQKAPNAWGLYDMHGNVAEWVADWYGHDYYVASPHVDPQGPDSGSYRVYRGGCWFDSPKFSRASLRNFDFPISAFYNVGFRVVR